MACVWRREGTALLPRAVGLILSIVACSDEFPTSSVVELSIDSTAVLNSTMMVRDTDTIAVQLTDPSGDPVRGVHVRWATSDPAKLELRTLPLAGLTRRDSLEGGMRIEVIAHARGAATVSATVDQSGFSPALFEREVIILEKWVQVTAGSGYTCALTIDHSAFCWGGTATRPPIDGLGNGSTRGSRTPVPVLGGIRFRSLAAGYNATCGLTEETGLLYCWGANEWGQLGTGNLQGTLIPLITVGGRTYTQVSTRQSITCATASDTVLLDEINVNTFCWGYASTGALGIGTNSPPGTECTAILLAGNVCVPQPVFLVQSFYDRADFLLHQVSVGGGFVCGLTEGGGLIQQDALYCWGLNTSGQTGVVHDEVGDEIHQDCAPSPGTDAPIPCSLRANKVDDRSYSTVSAGGSFACAVSSGAVYCWGLRYGSTPTLAAGPPEIDSVTVGGPFQDVEGFSDFSHACALTTSGKAYCWGNNSKGQLGTGDIDPPLTTPSTFHTSMLEVAQDTLHFTAISAGKWISTDFDESAHTCALTREGAIYCWGSNETGAIGVPGEEPHLRPTRISEP
jgi:alpha-tubulin suppressor-like RCC1 family protein